MRTVIQLYPQGCLPAGFWGGCEDADVGEGPRWEEVAVGRSQVSPPSKPSPCLDACLAISGCYPLAVPSEAAGGARHGAVRVPTCSDISPPGGLRASAGITRAGLIMEEALHLLLQGLLPTVAACVTR